MDDAQKLKTKVRRLYDIANVLQSIGLIEKTNQTHNKKPAFRWIGIEGVHNFVKELSEERKANGLADVAPAQISFSPPLVPTKKHEAS